jgi:16S rRNA (adenine1518-N6/adenine1519-N6)-dimethyltransferase
VTLSARAIQELLARHGLEPRRAFGQNFVADPNTVRRIARLAAVGPGDRVVEIGAGLGSLTLALAETGAAVTAVEVDHDLVPVLREVVDPVGVRVVEADALTLDWAGLLGDGPWVLVANLPYNVGTTLVLQLLDEVPAVERMLVMVQREVAERLAAPPGSRVHGIPSVKVAYWADAAVVGRVPPTVFVPRPRVESALVRIVRRHDQPADVDPDVLFALVRAGFAQRRKTLRRSLVAALGDGTGPALVAAGLDPSGRAEQVGLDGWVRLARVVQRSGPEGVGR